MPHPSQQSPTKRGSNASATAGNGFGVGSHQHFAGANTFFTSGTNNA